MSLRRLVRVALPFLVASICVVAPSSAHALTNGTTISLGYVTAIDGGRHATYCVQDIRWTAYGPICYGFQRTTAYGILFTRKGWYATQFTPTEAWVGHPTGTTADSYGCPILYGKRREGLCS